MTAPNQPQGPGAPAAGGEGGQAPTTAQQPTTAATQQPQAGPGAQPQQPPATGKTDLASLPADVQKLVADLRAENAQRRTEGQKVAAVLKALGLTPDGTEAPPDPAAVAAQVEQAQAAAWTNAVELATWRAATAAGADAERLLDSRAFIDSLDAFVGDDPGTPEFRTKLAGHINAYIGKNPAFKAPTTTSPGRSGPPVGGGTNSGGRPSNLREAFARQHKT